MDLGYVLGKQHIDTLIMFLMRVNAITSDTWVKIEISPLRANFASKRYDRT